MRLMSRLPRLLAGLVLVASACGDDGAPVAPDAAASCDVPAPIVAGTAETDALADAPARCGQAAHVWRRDATLGEVRAVGPVTDYAADFLVALLDTQGITLDSPPTYDTAVRRVTYQTQDRGALVDATTFVAYPTVPVEGAPLDVILLLHGTTGFTDGCGAGSDALYTILGAALAATGKIVVVPDYLGLRSDDEATGFPHPYLVGQATAIASLDAVRAALRLAPGERGGHCATARVAIVGGSQGGHAALWVDRLAPYYARELELAGVVATVPPMDLLGQTSRALTEIVDATGNTIAMLGSASPWYGAGLGGAFVPPWDADLPGLLAEDCSPDADVSGKQLSDVFTTAILDAASGGTLADLDPYGCIFAENGLTTTSVPRLGPDDPGYGILVVLSELDGLVHTPIERTAYEALCASGLPMQYLECAGAGHTDSTIWALGDIIAFLDARLAGEPLTPSCVAAAPVVCAGTPE